MMKFVNTLYVLSVEITEFTIKFELACKREGKFQVVKSKLLVNTL